MNILVHRIYYSLENSKEDYYRGHLDPEQVHQVREALNHELVLGRDDFKLKIEQITQGQTKPKSLGRPRVEEERGIYYIL